MNTNSGVCIPKRIIITFLMSLGSALVYILHVNVSIALVEMTDEKVIHSGNKTIHQKSSFDWNLQQEGLILSASSYGILLAPLGGILSTKFGGATVFGIIILLNGISTIIVPFLLQIHVGLFIVQRFIEGTVQGWIPASIMEICSHWAPPNEKSRIIVCGIVGIYLGAAINYPLCGYIAMNFDWEAIFYVTGTLSIIWYFLWISLVTNDPAEDKILISSQEKAFLKEVIEREPNEKIVYPWKSILTSKAVWAYINEFFVLGWSFSFILLGLPLYVKDMLDINIEEIGLISSIPDLCTIIGLPFAAFLADYLRANKILTVSNLHKIYISFGQASAAILLFAIGMWANFSTSIIFFSLFRFCYGFAEATYEVLPSDLAPRYSGVIRGIATTGQSLTLILSPTIMGLIVSDHTVDSWKLYFLVSSALNVWGGVIFYIFGSGETQPWAIEPKSDHENHRDRNSSTITEKQSNGIEYEMKVSSIPL